MHEILKPLAEGILLVCPRVVSALDRIADALEATGRSRTVGEQETILEARIGSAVNLVTKRGIGSITIADRSGEWHVIVSRGDDYATAANNNLADALECAARMWGGAAEEREKG